jgi:hypothetical protein
MKLKKNVFWLLGFSLVVWVGDGYADDKEGSKKLRVGKVHQGGVIVYVDGSSGLIAAPEIQSFDTPWTSESYEVRIAAGGERIPTGARGTKIGTGKTNTDLIVGVMGDGNYAAKICQNLKLNGYGDWFLPSKDELYMLHKNYKPFADGVFDFYGFVAGDMAIYKKVIKALGEHAIAYWSSSETTADDDPYYFFVWSQAGGDQGHGTATKAAVRCFRSF